MGTKYGTYAIYGVVVLVGGAVGIRAGVSPFFLLFLVACPLMMFFMMRGGTGGGHHDSKSAEDASEESGRGRPTSLYRDQDHDQDRDHH